MKYLKVGIPLMCALVAFAAFGAGTASATRLCSKNENPCPVVKRWLKETPIAANVGTPAQFATSSGNVNCQKAPMEGKTTSDGGGVGVQVTATISSLEFNECKLGSTPCTTTVEGLAYAVEIKWNAGENGLWKLSPEVKVVCGAVMQCKFTVPGVELELKGGVTAELVANAVVLSREGGFLCPTEAKLNAKWEFKSPGPLYVIKE